MTEPDKLSVLRAAIELWDANGRGVTAADIAARFDVDEGTAKRVLLPLIAEYFEVSLPGDDGIAVVRQPITEAREFADS